MLFRSSPSMPSAQECWVAPPPGFLKVNVDGASSIDGSGTSGIGVIIRDDLGGIVAALCKVLPVHYPTELTEFFALEHGVLLAQDLNISNVIFGRMLPLLSPLLIKAAAVVLWGTWCISLRLQNQPSLAALSIM